jgi:hypothetical protein
MNRSTEYLEASQVDSLPQGHLTPEGYDAAQEHLELCESCRARIESTIGPKRPFRPRLSFARLTDLIRFGPARSGIKRKYA